MITSLSIKKENGRKKGEKGKKEGKRKKRERKRRKKEKRERKRGKRKEIGKKEKDGFWLTQENKENLFCKKIIFFPQGERISYIFEI